MIRFREWCYRWALLLGGMAGLVAGYCISLIVILARQHARYQAVPSWPDEHEMMVRNMEGWIGVAGVLAGPSFGIVAAILIREALDRAKSRATKELASRLAYVDPPPDGSCGG